MAITGYLLDVTAEDAEPAINTLRPGFVWYSWTAPADGYLRLIWGHGVQAVLFNGSALGNLQRIHPTADGLNSFPIEGGETYAVAVGREISVSADVLSFQLSFEFFPSLKNDLLQNAEILPPEEARVRTLLAGMHHDPGEPYRPPEYLGETNFVVWYSYTPPTSGLLTLQGSSQRDILELYQGASLAELEVVTNAVRQSSARVPVTGGVTYSLAVIGPGNEPTEFSLLFQRLLAVRGVTPGSSYLPFPDRILTLEGIPATETVTNLTVSFDHFGPILQTNKFVSFPLPNVRGIHQVYASVQTAQGRHYTLLPVRYEITHPNDELETAPTLSGSVFEADVDTRQALNNTVWWKWTAPSSGYLFFTQLSGDFVMNIAEAPAREVVAGQAYSLSATWWAPVTGRFRATLLPMKLPQDDLGSARVWQTNLSELVHGERMTLEAIDPQPKGEGSAWYVLHASSPGVLNFDVTTALPGSNPFSLGIVADVFLGAALQRATDLSESDTRVATPLKPGEVCYVRVRRVQPLSGDQAVFVVNARFDAAPLNDDFANSIPIPAGPFSLNGATAEPGETNLISGQRAARTAWFHWRSPETGFGIIEIPTANTNVPGSLPLVEVFEGGSLNALERVGTLPLEEAVLHFPAEAHKLYKLRVSSSGGPNEPLTQLRVKLSEWIVVNPLPDSVFTFPEVPAFDLAGRAIFPGEALELRETSSPIRHDNHWWYSAETIGTTSVNHHSLRPTNVPPGMHYFFARATRPDGATYYSQVVPILIRPANDRFANAALLTDRNVTLRSYLGGASVEPGEPLVRFVQSTVWFKWVAPASGSIILQYSSTGNGFFPVIRVATGTSLESLQFLDSGVGSYVDAGTTYYFRLETGSPVEFTPHLRPLTWSFQLKSVWWENITNVFDEGTPIVLTPTLGEKPQDLVEIKYRFHDDASRQFEFVATTYPFSFVLTNHVPGQYFLDFEARTRSGEIITGRAPSEWSGEKLLVRARHAFAEGAIDLGAFQGTTDLPLFEGSGWFRWTAPGDGALLVPELSPTNSHNLRFEAFEATPGGLARVAVAPSLAAFPVRAGVSYLLRIFGFGSSAQSPSLEILFVTKPSNDDLGTAIRIEGDHPSGSAETFLATVEPNEPRSNYSLESANVWYRWRAPAFGHVTILKGVGLTVFEEAFSGGWQLHSRTNFHAEAGRDYLLMFEDRNRSLGIIPWEFKFDPKTPPGRPANDHFSDRFLVPGTAARLTAKFELSTMENTEAFPGLATNGRSAWWTWIAPADGFLLLKSRDYRHDAIALFRTANPFGTVPSEKGSDFVRAFVRSGETLHIRIAYDFETDVEIVFYEDLHNDNFADRKPLPSGSFVTSTAGSHREFAEPFHAGKFGGRSLWFEWTAPESGMAELRINDAFAGLLSAVYRGQTLSSLTEIASTSDPSRAPLSFSARAEETYAFAVDGELGAVGEFRAQLHFVPEIPLTMRVSIISPEEIEIAVDGLHDSATVSFSEELRTWTSLQSITASAPTLRVRTSKMGFLRVFPQFPARVTFNK